jgi:hypothetical protein
MNHAASTDKDNKNPHTETFEINMKKSVTSLFFLVLIVAVGIWIYSIYFGPAAPLEPTRISEKIEAFAQMHVTSDLSDYQIERTSESFLVLTLSKGFSKITLLGSKEMEGRRWTPTFYLLYLQEHSRGVGKKSRWWRPEARVYSEPRATDELLPDLKIDVNCFESQSCDETAILNYAIEYLSRELVGKPSGFPLDGDGKYRWSDQKEFRDFFRSLKATFEYERLNVFTFSRERCPKDCITDFDVIARDDGKILGWRLVSELIVESW